MRFLEIIIRCDIGRYPGGTSDNIRKYLKRDDDRMIVFAQSPGIAKKCVTSYNNSD